MAWCRVRGRVCGRHPSHQPRRGGRRAWSAGRAWGWRARARRRGRRRGHGRARRGFGGRGLGGGAAGSVGRGVAGCGREGRLLDGGAFAGVGRGFVESQPVGRGGLRLVDARADGLVLRGLLDLGWFGSGGGRRWRGWRSRWGWRRRDERGGHDQQGLGAARVAGGGSGIEEVGVRQGHDRTRVQREAEREAGDGQRLGRIVTSEVHQSHFTRVAGGPNVAVPGWARGAAAASRGGRGTILWP
jgi:hypothetical protein